MKVGLIGLGKMGKAIGYRLVTSGYEVYGVDPDRKAHYEAKKIGITISQLNYVGSHTQVIWLMLPSGRVVDKVIEELIPYITNDMVIIDGGNSKYTDSMRRAHLLQNYGVSFLDCGTSGGLAGKHKGFCLMIGGSIEAYEKIKSLCKVIAAPNGYAYIGKSGTGHYVKMIHNGIEYALLQAYAEGFHLINNGTFAKEDLNLELISSIWNEGSVIRSWILKLFHDLFSRPMSIKTISGKVPQTGMGAWTVENAKQSKIPVPVIEMAVKVRTQSEISGGNYATKLVALLRNAFGGHPINKI